MKLLVSFLALSEQRNRLGAPASKWSLNSKRLSPRETILSKLVSGISIEIGDLETSTGGLLSYKGEQVFLYIKDTNSSKWTLENEPEKSRKFHIAECSTLDDMRSKGRFERYVVTNDTSGDFQVDWLDPDTRERGETIAKLKVCKNCLKTLDWCGYLKTENRSVSQSGTRTSKSEIFNNFDMSVFLLEFSTFFHQKSSRMASEAELNIYVPKWSGISQNRRRAANWQCDECGVHLAQAPWALHCHHRNGVVTDNRNSNLEVLCALCHSEQPDHGHMQVSASIKNTILKARTA